MAGMFLRLLAFATGLAVAACTSSSPLAREAAMSSADVTSTPRMMPAREWPLRFTSHKFAVHCYDTYACKVVYAGRVQRDDDPTALRPSSAGYGSDYQRSWSGIHGMIRNFPPPAVVTWRSRDGTAHEASIDMERLFADHLIRHNVSREEMADLPGGKYESEPAIVLEVNDRTVRVYMRAMIFLKKQVEIAGVLRADFKDDLILVESYTF